MNVIVNIPKEVLEHPHNYCCYALANQIKGNYTPIPDNATNGDMVKIMFPKAWESNYIDISNKFTLYIDNDYELEVDVDWWNSPYEGVEK